MNLSSHASTKTLQTKINTNEFGDLWDTLSELGWLSGAKIMLARVKKSKNSLSPIY